MGEARPKTAVAVRRSKPLAPETLRAIRVAGGGGLAGAAMGAAIGGSIGVAALGGAIGVPVVAVGAVIGAAAAGFWNLFFGGSDRKRARLIQGELETALDENRELRGQLSAQAQEAMDAQSTIDRLTVEVSRLRRQVRGQTGVIEQLRDAAPEAGTGAGAATQYWVGVTQMASAMVFDPACQMSAGRHVLLFLPDASCYRVFEKRYIRPKLTKLEGEQCADYCAKYEEWLRDPINQDARIRAIAQLVKRTDAPQK